jgi:hypothetical protein
MLRMGPASVKPLSCLLIDEGKDEQARIKAAELLGELGDGRAVEPLCQALKAGEFSLRVKAAEMLIKLYKGSNLDEYHKKMILSQKSEMQNLHDDSWSKSCEFSLHDDIYVSGIELLK